VARITVSTAQLAALEQTVLGFVRVLRRLALAAAAVVLLLVVVFRRDGGLDGGDVVLTLLLLTPSAIVLFFTRGVLELVTLPGRLQQVPGESQERLAELTQIAGDPGVSKVRSAPFLLWRLRGPAGTLRDVAGVAVTIRSFTPAFLAAAAISAFACIAIIGIGLIALIVAAVG
jgi:hypothetical protein